MSTSKRSLFVALGLTFLGAANADPDALYPVAPTVSRSKPPKRPTGGKIHAARSIPTGN